MLENLGGAGGGTQSDHWAAGGGGGSGSATTQIYNGSAWVSAPDLSTARGQLKGKSPTSAGAIGCGGYNGTAVQTATEEFSPDTDSVKTVTTA